MITPNNIVHHKRSKTLELTWTDLSATLSAEFLRVKSTSAEVKGHGPDQAVLQHGKRDVAITGIEYNGHYAIRISFDDGHDTGIYSWQYLRQLAEQQETLWQEYLDELSAAQLSRDPNTSVVKFITP